MLSVKLYQHSLDFYKLGYLRRTGKTVVVCPNPVIADDIRLRFSRGGKTAEAEVLTISKFTKDLFDQVIPGKTVSRKADILLELSIAWKLKFAKVPDESFFLRSNFSPI